MNESKDNPCKSVLVIEDDEAIREMLKLFLELEGYAVATAHDGQDGLNVLPKTVNLGLILLDLMMPVMNGWDFLAAIKGSEYSEVPVLIVTAYPEQADAIANKGILGKPIDMAALESLVKRWCGIPMRRAG